MATETHMFRGKVKWPKVYQLNKYGKWTLDLYPDADSLDKFKALKVKNHLKKDEDGYYFSVSRPPQVSVRGKIFALTAPIVLDKNNIPTTVAIGNGSDVTVKVDYYSYRKGTPDQGYAMRLNSLRIDNLVPYGDESRDEGEIKDVKDFKNVPIAF